VTPFVLGVTDVFRISPGVTVLVGEVVSSAPEWLAPCDVEIRVGGQSRGWIWLNAEQLFTRRRRGGL
jgi:hypothetical protein